MRECSKSIVRRMGSSNFMRRYFVGDGVDVGGQPDPLSLYKNFFPQMNSVRIWDLQDGDAQFMAGVPDGHFDFLHSSHCLEHLHDPREGLANWLRVVKPGGFVVVIVPDEDMYEQGVFPSTFNRDHKWTFTAFKTSSWSNRSLNVLELLQSLGGAADVERVEVLNASYRYDLPRYDQTLTPIGECGIEFVIRKRTPEEIAAGGRLPRPVQPSPQDRIYLNQYRHDQAAMKSSNANRPPFTDDTLL